EIWQMTNDKSQFVVRTSSICHCSVVICHLMKRPAGFVVSQAPEAKGNTMILTRPASVGTITDYEERDGPPPIRTALAFGCRPSGSREIRVRAAHPGPQRQARRLPCLRERFDSFRPGLLRSFLLHLPRPPRASNVCPGQMSQVRQGPGRRGSPPETA